MASPLAQLAVHVPAALRGRGEAFAVHGKVELRDAAPNRLRAIVRGLQSVDVALTRHDKVLLASCSCAVVTLTLCEHVWACVVVAQKERCKILRAPVPTFLFTELPGLGSEKPGFLGGASSSSPVTPSLASARPVELEVPMAQLGLGRLLHSRARQAPRAERASGRRAQAVAVQQQLQPAARKPPVVHYVFSPLRGSDTLRLDLVIGAPPVEGPITVGTYRIEWHAWRCYQDPLDGEVLELLLGRPSPEPNGRYGRFAGQVLRSSARDRLLEAALRTGRAYFLAESGRVSSLRGDDGEPWTFVLRVREAPDGGFDLDGLLRRGDRTVPLGEADAVFSNGTLLLGGRVGRLDDGGGASWVGLLRAQGTHHCGPRYRGAFFEELFSLPRRPPLELPEGREPAVVTELPVPCLLVRAPAAAAAPPASSTVEPVATDTSPAKPRPAEDGIRVEATLAFDYLGTVVPAGKPGKVVYDAAAHRLAQRDVEAEARGKATLERAGFQLAGPRGAAGEAHIAPGRFGVAVRTLLDAGFRVEGAGTVYRRPGPVRLAVRSGQDWFDVRGHVDFEGISVGLPALLAAARRGDPAVVLDDGTLGLLPEDWLERHGFAIRLGEVRPEGVRFRRAQLGLLDALLAAQPEANADAKLQRAREELRTFEKIAPADPDRRFTGTLRAYQREGLAWLSFLERFGFGGCLADEMGLGKTIQVLAHLASRAGGARGPSLVVAPRSLLFNWRDEAARFVPTLRVLEHSGVARLPPGAHFRDFDLILTTYGTLRRDAVELAAFPFDYAILDEAQAIKNDGSEAAKAARLLRADHRLVLSGTPIENHLGELWSLFEFMNPGMLGSLSAFRGLLASGQAVEEPARVALSRALRPFLLRRTKAEVAPELPPRVDETLVCEMGKAQRTLYEELRQHYRGALLGFAAGGGLGRAKLHVLEALLRLRQAACHPGLVDPGRKGEPSAKLDALFDALSPVLEGGHKALVFSQFTSLLDLVRKRLDEGSVPYAYLDGGTRDREAPVQRFQTDPGCKLFLVSLKAGGTGLNLTAAEYVFLLDPWWNPAVEAQAMDRAHRLGQTKTVFTYRLVARDTIEQRILSLQQEKRSLAGSLLDGTGSLLQELTAEDLERLLS